LRRLSPATTEKRGSSVGTRIRFLATLASLLVSSLAAAQPSLAEEAPVADGAKLLGALNTETWQTAEGLIPAEFLEHYKSGAWTHEIWEAPTGTHYYDADFIAAGEQNKGRYDIGSDGQVVEIATGKQPGFIYGPPFPDIDPSDPKAGAKVVWNFFYQSYILGNSRNFVNLDWVGSKGMERRLRTDVYQRYFDGQPLKYRPDKNPQNFLFQQISGVTAPADLQGTVSLTHRFRDPKQRDQVWTFVPALRRVRAVSPANRSDGFLGSDMSQDDGSYFDGKPEDFTWRLVGEGEILMLFDRESLLHRKSNINRLPSGGFEGHDSLRPRFAYQTGKFTGLAWAPIRSEFVLNKRPVWIVEGVPKDKYYLYGKILLRLDKEAWRGTYNSKYDWKGEILNSYLPVYGPYYDIDGEWRSYASALFTMAQNWRLFRATVSYADPENPVQQSRIPYPDSFFTVDELTRRGK
jgi:hypothetical protein